MLQVPSLDAAAELVRATARRELLPRFAAVQSREKADGSLISDADLAVQKQLIAELDAAWPGYPILSEERPDRNAEALAARDRGIWCLDPLDGTSNFVAGLPYYAVSLAFLRGDAVEFGIVYDPCRDECFTAYQGRGAWLNGLRIIPGEAPQRLADTLALIDFKRVPIPLRERLSRRPPYKSQRSLGAVALDFCWLACRRCHLYLHGRQRLWDYAAGLLVLTESGGLARTLSGDPVFQPTLEARSTVAACDATLFAAWSAWVDTPAEG